MSLSGFGIRMMLPLNVLQIYFKDFIYLVLDSVEGREKEERNISVWLSAPTGDLDRNPGMCFDWQLNHWPFDAQGGTESTDPHQPGLFPDMDQYFWSIVGWIVNVEPADTEYQLYFQMPLKVNQSLGLLLGWYHSFLSPENTSLYIVFFLGL